MNRGDVVNIEQTTHAIKRAVENAEHIANCRAQSVYVGISGKHIRRLNSTGVAPGRAGSVSDRDVDSWLDAARAIAIPAARNSVVSGKSVNVSVDLGGRRYIKKK